MSYFQITRVSVVLLAALFALFTGWQIGSAKLERKRQNQVAPAVSATEVSGKIAYADHSPDGLYLASTDIFIMNQDGTAKTQLTHIKTLASDPIWSPDGQRIAYTGCHSSRNCETSGEPVFIDLYSIGVDGSNPKQLTSDLTVFERPSWSPDGSKIAFATTDAQVRPKIFVIPADGGAPTQITVDPAGSSDGAQDSFPTWSPDGTRLLFIRYVPFVPTRLYSIKPDGTDLQLIKDFSGSGLAWSPDGKQIAFSSGADDGQIFLMNPDGTNQRGILQGGQPSWSPDSQQLVFSRFENPCSTGGGNVCYGIYTANLDGTGLKRIGSGIRPAWQPSKIKNPLIFIPGVAGSQLGETVQNVPPFPPYFLEYWLSPSEFTSLTRLTLDPNRTQFPIHTNDVLRKVGALGFEDDQYDGLIKALVNRGGYREYKIESKLERLTTSGCDDVAQGKDRPDLFIFPYDWRRSNAENSAKLKDYVGCVKRFYKDSKVDILTHSMGSLLARRYVLDNPGTHNVDKHISIGAPWLGAAKFLATMEYGLFLENPADKVLGPPLKTLVEFFPGPHELMPSRAYFQLGGRPFATHDVRTVPTNFRQLESWDELSQYVDGQFARSKPATANDLFHNNILLPGQDDWTSDQSGVKYFHIIGRQKAPSTISQVVKKLVVRCGVGGLCSPVTEYDTLRGVGDGTVPELSAARNGNGFNLNAPNATVVTFCGGDSKEEEKNVSHTKLVLYPLVQDQAMSFLRGSTQKISPCDSSANAETKGAAALTGSEGLAYYINVFGADTNSVDVANSGGFSTTATADYPLGRDVPGVTYTILSGKDVSLVLNKNETYTVTLTAGGDPLVVRATLGTGNGVTQAVRYQDLVLPAGVKAVIKTGPNGIEGLKYDANGDGTFETSVQPSASVTGAAAQDIDPPTVSINSTRQANNAVVTITSSDSGSGVKAIYHSTDGTHFQQYAGPFTVDIGQVSTIYAFADDNVANRSGLVTFALPAPVTVQLESAAYTVSEGQGFATINVMRGGDISAPATVNYATSDTNGLTDCAAVTSKASERCDYVTTIGRLSFAPGETAKSFVIPLIDDVWVEGNEAFTVTLSSPTGATVVSPNIATVNISDNDGNSGAANPIDGVEFFILQQYRDILNRQPDSTGLQNWINTLGPCPNGGFGEPPTSNCDRLHVAAGFFQSDEFLNRGYFAFRFYMVAFNQRPTYTQFIPDMAQVGGPKSPAEEEASKVAYADAFVQRPEFLARYGSASGQTLASALLATAGLPGPYNAGSQTNGQILRGIAESSAALNKFLTEGTVSIMYFGFQRRDPDAIGYQNNLNTLNASPNNLRHMIFIFIYSTEYRSRFGP